MADEFHHLTSGLDGDQVSGIDEAAAIHAHYFHRLTRYHGIPEQIAAGFTEMFMQYAVEEPE